MVCQFVMCPVQLRLIRFTKDKGGAGSVRQRPPVRLVHTMAPVRRVVSTQWTVRQPADRSLEIETSEYTTSSVRGSLITLDTVPNWSNYK
jgi:hypothetical protein